MSSRAGGTRLRIVDVFERDGVTRLEPRTVIAATPDDVALVAPKAGAEATMLWDVDLDQPDAELVGRLLRGPCHVWHAGLRLGQGDRPAAWSACHSRAMFSRDADPDIESTSWRLSLRAVVIRNEAIDAFGGFDPGFDTASGCALEAGLRWINHGALIRHVPDLLHPASPPPLDAAPTPRDGLRIVRRRLGRIWALWALLRGLRTESIRARQVPQAMTALVEPRPQPRGSFGLPAREAESDGDARVTVLVPTVGRYPFLEELLPQLAAQTRPPDEVIVVDQNPEAERRELRDLAADLPLRVLHLLPPGQCTARNLGLQASTGSHILFLDDDDEIPPDLIEQHLHVLACPEVSVSCGLVDDAESGPAPASQRFRQAGSTFPTNNAMIRRSVLEVTGLFDPTYDRGARADHDLGMRSYLTGHLHVYDPRPQVFHHHAPMGGLRTHGARVRTRGNSRSTLVQRHLRTPTDVYLGLRYYTDEQVREDLLVSAFATLSGGGSRAQRAARFVVQLVLLPDTWARTKEAYREGKQLLLDRPEIPTLVDVT